MASQLFVQRAQPCALSPYIFMSDPERTPDILRSAAGLPFGSTMIYRHFGAENKYAVAKALRQICFVRNIQFLIGQDEGLAREIGADGLHLPERELVRAEVLRARYPDWLLSGAVHRRGNLRQCAGLDAAIVSPVFESQSPSAGRAIGVAGFTDIVRASDVAVFALGGVNAETALKLVGSGASGLAGVSGFAGLGL